MKTIIPVYVYTKEASILLPPDSKLISYDVEWEDDVLKDIILYFISSLDPYTEQRFFEYYHAHEAIHHDYELVCIGDFKDPHFGKTFIFERVTEI